MFKRKFKGYFSDVPQKYFPSISNRRSSAVRVPGLFLEISCDLKRGREADEKFEKDLQRLSNGRVTSLQTIHTEVGKGIDYIIRTLVMETAHSNPDFVHIVLPCYWRHEYFALDGSCIDIVAPWESSGTNDGFAGDVICQFSQFDQATDRFVEYLKHLETLVYLLDRMRVKWGVSLSNDEANEEVMSILIAENRFPAAHFTNLIFDETKYASAGEQLAGWFLAT